MRIEGHRIWITLFIAIFIVSGYLYYSVRENQQQLTEQSIRSLTLTKNNLSDSWDNLIRRPELSIPDTFPDKNEPETGKILRELLDMMRPGDFFDILMVSDTAGNVLISNPDIPMQSIPSDAFSGSDQLGITKTGLNISAEDYQVYRVPVTLVEDQDEDPDQIIANLYLYGAISQDRYNQAGWQISFTVLYLLGSLVVFIIVSYPILRVVGMGRGDTLLRTHIYQIGLSIILLSIFIGFSVSYFSSRSEIMSDQYNTVSTLYSQIESLHQESLSQYTQFLASYMSDKPTPVDQHPVFNEIFKIDSTGTITEIEFGDPAEAVHIDSLPNIEDRYYFRRAREGEYFLGSHFSYIDGRQEGVLSIKDSTAVEEDNSGVVQAITFSFDRLNNVDTDSLNPQNLKYLIINERGEVYYQSPSIRTIIPEIRYSIRETEWNEVRALMENNVDLEGSLEVPLSFEGQSYVGHLTQLELPAMDVHEQFWILTLRDKNLRYLRSFSVFMYSAAGYFFLVFILLIISLFSYMSRRPSHYLNIKPFSFDWLKPSHKKRKNYQFLFIVILLHTIFFLFVISRDVHNFWFIVLLFCETICFITLYGYILLSDFLENRDIPASWMFPSAVFITSVILLFLAYRASTLGGGNLFLLMLLLFIFQIFVIGIIAFKHNRNDFRAEKDTHEAGFIVPETMFAAIFTLWAGMIGLFPGYAIHHFAFHFEDVLWQKAVEPQDHQSLKVITQSLPVLEVNQDEFSAVLKASGGTTPYRWDIAEGDLPDSLQLNEDGTISGIPFETGDFTFTVKVTDDDSLTSQNEIFLKVREKNTSSSNAIEFQFLNQMEYQRRQWMGNYTGIEYPVIDRYIYTDRQIIRGAMEHDHPEHGLETHEKGSYKYALMLLFLIIIGYLLFLLIRNLTRRIFLTHYWDFDYKSGVVKTSGDEMYIITLNNREALDFLDENFLQDKKYKIYDFASQSIFEIMASIRGNTVHTVDGFILQNVERSLYLSDEIQQLVKFISECKKLNKFVVITGVRSIKELREDVSGEDKDLPMKNWLEAMSTFITIILPLHYAVDESKTEPGNTPIEKVKEDIKYTPHESTLAVLLQTQLESGDKPFLKSDYEKFLLIIQRYNKAWYQNIWEKLTFREKQMVYNYANEGFVNHCNFDVLTELLQKGVFRMDHGEEKISLFNKSFRNYATRAPSVELLEQFRKDRRENGNLKHLRNAMLTFVFLVILGVSLVAPDILDRYIGAISGGLAILSTLASALSKFSLKLPFFKNSKQELPGG